MTTNCGTDASEDIRILWGSRIVSEILFKKQIGEI